MNTDLNLVESGDLILLGLPYHARWQWRLKEVRQYVVDTLDRKGFAVIAESITTSHSKDGDYCALIPKWSIVAKQSNK